jgi:hypothetical protein
MTFISRLLFAGLVVGQLVACQSTSEPNSESALSVENLKTPEEHQAFLENIYELDQRYRHQEDSVLQQFGHDSPEHQAIWETIKNTDVANFQAIQQYLTTYGHPDPAVVGELAASAPWIVVHHASSYESRAWAFPYFYPAYQKGHLDEGQFSFYLNRMYRIANGGEEFPIESPFREEDRIQGIIKALDLSVDSGGVLIPCHQTVKLSLSFCGMQAVP